MGRHVTMKLDGEDISLSSLASALVKTEALLAELDHMVSGRKTVTWRASRLLSGSAIFDASPIPVDDDAPDNVDAILSNLEQGLVALESGPERPENYSDEALGCFRDLADISGNGAGNLTCIIAYERRISECFPVTRRISVNVTELLGKTKKSIGSVEGIVQMITGFRDYFTIVDRTLNRNIQCYCDKATLNEIAELWDKRILVSGEITEDKAGRPKSIKVKRYRRLRDRSELPQVEDIAGLYKDLYAEQAP